MSGRRRMRARAQVAIAGDCRACARRSCSARSRCCSPGSLGRSLYLQWIDNEFLQEQGAARYSRELEVPAHRGRIVDRIGEALAISTPVKSLWAFPDKLEATPDAARAARALLETTPQALRTQLERGRRLRVPREADSARDRRSARWRCASRACTTQNEYRRYYPGGEVTAHIVGFTGDQRRRARKASSSRSRTGSAASRAAGA